MKIFNSDINNSSSIEKLSLTLREKGVIELTELFDKSLITQLTNDVLNIFEQHKKRKELLMVHTENTPRYMFSVSQSVIHESSPFIVDFYNHPKLLEFLSTLAKMKVMILPIPVERYVINGLSSLNDTHGWHWDDYSYTLILIAKAPKPGEGGQIQTVPNSFDGTSKIEEVLQKNTPENYSYADGTMYLMKSDTTLHRVAPLTVDNSLRISLAMTFCTDEDLVKDIDHRTIYDLYGQ